MLFSFQGMQMLASLRQKRQTTAANTNPVFGPPPSNGIFESKWLFKLNRHNLAFPEDVSIETIAAHVSQAFDLVTAFHDEARTLSLTSTDFTYEPVSGIQGTLCEIVYVNPFTVAEILRLEVNFHVDEWKALWQVEPALVGMLKLRAQILKAKVEFVMVKVFEAEFAGVWDPSGIQGIIAGNGSAPQAPAVPAAQIPLRPKQRRKWW